MPEADKGQRTDVRDCIVQVMFRDDEYQVLDQMAGGIPLGTWLRALVSRMADEDELASNLRKVFRSATEPPGDSSEKRSRRVVAHVSEDELALFRKHARHVPLSTWVRALVLDLSHHPEMVQALREELLEDRHAIQQALDRTRPELREELERRIAEESDAKAQ